MVLERDPKPEFKIDHVYWSGLQRDLAGAHHGMSCRMLYFALKEELFQKSWMSSPVEFAGVVMQLLPDLSSRILYMHRVVRSLLGKNL